MKNKSSISNWAIALCAVAVFSLTSTGTAYGRLRAPTPLPGPDIQPTWEVTPVQPTWEVTPIQPSEEVTPRPQPLPPIGPPVDLGTYKGTVID
jgi:hypothetical protein